MYSVDSIFWETANDNLIASINLDRFKSYGNYNEIRTFEMSADRNQIYFADVGGYLFRYTIAEDTLELLIDLMPDSIKAGAAGLLSLVWENDSTLYFGGRAYGRYNLSTGELENIFTIDSDEVYDYLSIVTPRIVKHKERYIYTSLGETLMELNLNNPSNSEVLDDYLSVPGILFPVLVSYQYDCDSIGLYVESGKDAEHPDLKWYKIDMETYELIPTEYPGDMQYLFVNYYADCRIIDLDMDNSTAEGYDFWLEVPCYNSAIPISDVDIDIKNLKPLDSITVMIKNATSGQYINIPQGNYDIIRANTANVAIVNNGSTTNEELQKAIIDAMYVNTGAQKNNDVEIEVLAWYNGIAGDMARAYIQITAAEPTVTPVDATICEGDTFPFLDKEYYEIGEYADTLKDINGCDSAYFDINLTYFERSAIVLTGDKGFCEGESTTLTILSEHRDLKLDGENIQNTIEISEPGSYLLTGYDNNDCLSELRFQVSAYPNPHIFAEDIVDAEFSEPIKMPVDYSEGVVSYTWTPLSGLDCYDCPFPNITEPKDAIYTVEVTDENGCVSTQNINVSFKKIEYDIPNAIFNKPVHPDNGIFYVKSNISFNYDLEIYDRWGNVLYRAENIRTNDASAGWSPEGKVNSGVFVYKIEFDERGEKRVVVGDVTVL